jgi:hypothetical protein
MNPLVTISLIGSLIIFVSFYKTAHENGNKEEKKSLIGMFLLSLGIFLFFTFFAYFLYNFVKL